MKSSGLSCLLSVAFAIGAGNAHATGAGGFSRETSSEPGDIRNIGYYIYNDGASGGYIAADIGFYQSSFQTQAPHTYVARGYNGGGDRTTCWLYVVDLTNFSVQSYSEVDTNVVGDFSLTFTPFVTLNTTDKYQFGATCYLPGWHAGYGASGLYAIY